MKAEKQPRFCGRKAKLSRSRRRDSPDQYDDGMEAELRLAGVNSVGEGHDGSVERLGEQCLPLVPASQRQQLKGHLVIVLTITPVIVVGNIIFVSLLITIISSFFFFNHLRLLPRTLNQQVF